MTAVENKQNMSEKPNLSPCISRCSLDQEDVCIGCFRHVSEIRAWRNLEEVAQKEILVLCEQRKNIK